MLVSLLFATVTFINFIGCASEKAKENPIKVEGNKFRTLNANNRGGSSERVVCHNCSAEFKLSPKIQKMSMKGDAVVECPVCHHNYLEKSK